MNINTIRKEFPILKMKMNGHPLVYLDSASTTQKPRAVINALRFFYEKENANIHRGVYELSEKATERYEHTRTHVARFINAAHREEVIFTKGCTEGINLVAHSWGRAHIRHGDHILVSALEHHANLVPWQELAREKKAHLIRIPLRDDLTIDSEKFESLLSKRTRLVCITAQSNVLGSMPPITKIIQYAHRVGARVLVDGAQSVGHQKTDVQKWDCDFLSFSSHKMLGPTGLGVLYVKKEVGELMPPYQVGGDMVETVSFTRSSYRGSPWRFEAGTPPIAEVVAFDAALSFLERLGMKHIEAHGRALFLEAHERFSSYSPRVRLFPKNPKEASDTFSFTVDGVHAHDVASVFASCGVAVRSGHHCAEPLMRTLGVPATARLSFYLYNTLKDIDAAERALKKVFHTFKLRTEN